MNDITEAVRTRYAAAAIAVAARDGRGVLALIDDACCSPGCCAAEAIAIGPTFGAGLYGDDADGLPADARAASLGCGNPLMVADLRPGERVLDLARANAATAGATNSEFLSGTKRDKPA